MGRKLGSKNKPRAPTASGSVAISHNESKAKDELTDADKHALLMDGVRKYKAALADKQEAEKDARTLGSVFKTTCKSIISGGISIDEVKSAILQETAAGQAVVKARVELDLRVARYMGAPLGTQFEIFDDDRTPSVDKARAAGKNLGLQGGDRDAHNWHPGTPQYEAHYDGYAEGQKVNIAGIKQKDGEEFDREQSERYDPVLADSDTSDPLGSPTIAETIHAADPFGDGVVTDPEASANQTANITPISNGRSKRNGRGGSKDAEPITAA